MTGLHFEFLSSQNLEEDKSIISYVIWQAYESFAKFNNYLKFLQLDSFFIFLPSLILGKDKIIISYVI